jgi:CRISPR-associated protein Csm1
MEIYSVIKPILIEGLQKVVEWYRADGNFFLISIFDQVGFKKREDTEKPYFVVPTSLSSRIIYPVKDESKTLKSAKKDILGEITEKNEGFADGYLAGLSTNELFFLLEKFGGSVPIDQKGDTSVFDLYRIRAAREVIQSNREALGHKDNLLINIDVSGIQHFIYNISSTGALKNLRSRSFFIELLCNHIVLQVLRAYNLHYANVLMNGGGSIYILSGASGRPDSSEQELQEISDSTNTWLLKEFDGMLYAAFSYVSCTDEVLQSNLAGILDELALKAFEAKQTKFKSLIEKGKFEFTEEKDPVYPGCDMCKRDDAGTKYYSIVKDDERIRCSLCERLSKLGSRIPRTRFIYASDKDTEDCLKMVDTYYLFSDTSGNSPCLFAVYEEGEEFHGNLKDGAIPIFARTFTKKNKELPSYVYEEIKKERERINLLLASENDRGAKQSLEEDLDALKDENTATIEYMAQSSAGAKYIAALRMDADNVGKVLHGGFRNGSTLEGISSFSRNLNYFFKLHLEFLCRYGFDRGDKKDVLAVKGENGRNVHVIYAGGDDLFVLGAWSDTACLAIDVGESFTKYTCGNIDMGVSGGITLHNEKFPVSRMAEASLAGLSFAKKNYQPCWMCRDNWVGCPLYELGNCLRKDSMSLFYTGHMAFRKKRLDEIHRPAKYSAEASRLKLALKWKFCDAKGKDLLNVVNEVNDYVIEPLKAFREKGEKVSRGFFHNVLSLVDTWYDEGLMYLPKIVWILQKFKTELRKHVANSEEGESLYDLYEMYLHLHDSKRFSTLYLPLSWNILLMKGENRDED